MILYYSIRILEALIVFAGITLGAAIICKAADEIERMREQRGGDE